jgi:hypothetical protein
LLLLQKGILYSSRINGDVLASGMDPNYDLLKNGKKTGVTLADLFWEGH